MSLSGAAGRPGQDLAALGVGLMLQPGNAYAATAERFPFWAADNGCYAKGERFDHGAFYAWLERVPRSRCLFAVAPDVFPDAAATMARSAPVLPVLRAMRFPAAFVAQDGLERLPIPWATFDALFLGGTTAWKLGRAARELVREAKAQGKHVHMGRVNSQRRLRYATLIGCDSADGTFLKFANRAGLNGLPRLAAWFRQPVLFGASDAPRVGPPTGERG